MSYIGPPITVADVVVRPSRSIIKQSYDARERRNDSSLPFHLGYGNLNGDGFGIGWFPPEPTSAKADHTPCVSRCCPLPLCASTACSNCWQVLMYRQPSLPCCCCLPVPAGLHQHHPGMEQ
jgi:hypothetical protein